MMIMKRSQETKSFLVFSSLCPKPGNFLSDNGYKNSIILGSVGGALAVSAIAVTIILVVRGNRYEENEVDEDQRIDQNPVYGIYEESPVYNTVEDTDDYFE